MQIFVNKKKATMKTVLDCFPCIMQQALKTARLATQDESQIKEILDRTGAMFKEMDMACPPPQLSTLMYHCISEVTRVKDPYASQKFEHIEEANRIYDELNILVKDSSDPLLTAIRLSIAGNVIDLGVEMGFDLKEDIKKMLDQEFAVFDYDNFKKDLSGAKRILFLGDNSGETVFDKLLIETINKPVVYAVRESPIINDATMKEARLSGLHEVAEVISSGSPAPGTILSMCNEQFLEIYRDADLIISKGQGNFEGLSDRSENIYFMLKAKCKVIANHLSVEMGDIILKEAKKGAKN